MQTGQCDDDPGVCGAPEDAEAHTPQAGLRQTGRPAGTGGFAMGQLRKGRRMLLLT